MSRRPDGEPPVLTKSGLTYIATIDEVGTTITFSRVKRRSETLTAYVIVRAPGLDVQTLSESGVLTIGILNLMGPKVRLEFAKSLISKTPGYNIDWTGILDHLAEKIIAAEFGGEPVQEIGLLPVAKVAETWALEPFVPASGAALFYGPGGSGKSRFALAAALSVRLGREIIPGVRPGLKGNILYLDWETDKDTVAERLQMICRGLNVPAVGISYRRCIRPLADDVEELSVYIAAKKIVFLVIDSASAAIGNQGEYGDANEGTLKLFAAIRIMGLPTMVVDHVSKTEMRMTGKVRGALPYGSIYRVNMARGAWELRAVEVDDESEPVTSFHHTKTNDSRLRDPFGITANFDGGAVQFRRYDGPLSAYDGLEDGATQRRVIAQGLTVRLEHLLRGARMTVDEAAAASGGTRDSVRALFNQSRIDGQKRFEKDDEGGWTLAVSKLVADEPPGGGGIS